MEPNLSKPSGAEGPDLSPGSSHADAEISPQTHLPDPQLPRQEAVRSWDTPRLANYIASDHVTEQKKLELAPSIFKELAARLRAYDGADLGVARKLYRRLMEGWQGEFAKEEGYSFTPAEPGHFRAELTFGARVSLRLASADSARECSAEILERIAERLADGRISSPGEYCFASDHAAQFLTDARGYGGNRWA
jgi:hypothetical protein